MQAMILSEDTHVSSIKELLDSFVVCRTVGHSWDEDLTAEWNTVWSWVLPLRCVRCTCQRLDALNTLGEVISRNYRYPNGYRVTRTRQGNKITRAELRKELMRRQVLARRRPGKPGGKPKLQRVK